MTRPSETYTGITLCILILGLVALLIFHACSTHDVVSPIPFRPPTSDQSDLKQQEIN